MVFCENAYTDARRVPRRVPLPRREGWPQIYAAHQVASRQQGAWRGAGIAAVFHFGMPKRLGLQAAFDGHAAQYVRTIFALNSLGSARDHIELEAMDMCEWSPVEGESAWAFRTAVVVSPMSGRIVTAFPSSDPKYRGSCL